MAKQEIKIIGKTYKSRVKCQTNYWLNGKSIHNHIDDECCPDFSCCKPHLLADKKTRKKFVSANDTERENMLWNFLGELLVLDKKKKVFVSNGKNEIKQVKKSKLH